MMWGGAVRDFENRGELREALARSITIDPSQPDPSKNGRLVVAPGTLTAPALVGDPYIKPGHFIVLERHVEMFQWAEKWLPGATAPEYELGWYPGQIDFFQFREPQGHENPLLAVRPERIVATDVRFSGFDGGRIAQVIDPKQQLTLSQDVLVDPNAEIQDNKIIIRREAGRGAFLLGDMRVWYEAAPAGEYTVMTVQKDERSLLGSETTDDLIIKPGNLDKEEFLKEEGKEAEKNNFSILYVGAAVFWLGLLSLLGSRAHQLDLRPKLDVRGFPAALLLSFVISVVVLTVFWVLALVG